VAITGFIHYFGGKLLRAKYELGNAIPVAQDDKNQAAMIASPVNPAIKSDSFAFIFCPQFSACVVALILRKVVQVSLQQLEIL
jgi:hypothetical protein